MNRDECFIAVVFRISSADSKARATHAAADSWVPYLLLCVERAILYLRRRKCECVSSASCYSCRGSDWTGLDFASLAPATPAGCSTPDPLPFLNFKQLLVSKSFLNASQDNPSATVRKPLFRSRLPNSNVVLGVCMSRLLSNGRGSQ